MKAEVSPLYTITHKNKKATSHGPDQYCYQKKKSSLTCMGCRCTNKYTCSDMCIRSPQCTCANASALTCTPTSVQAKLHSTFFPWVHHVPSHTLNSRDLIQGSSWENHCTCPMLGLMPMQSWRGTQTRGRATKRRKSIISGTQQEVKYLQKAFSITLQQKEQYTFVWFAQH